MFLDHGVMGLGGLYGAGRRWVRKPAGGRGCRMWCRRNPARAAGLLFRRLQGGWRRGNQRKKCVILKSGVTDSACRSWRWARRSPRCSRNVNPEYTRQGKQRDSAKRVKPRWWGLQGRGGGEPPQRAQFAAMPSLCGPGPPAKMLENCRWRWRGKRCECHILEVLPLIGRRGEGTPACLRRHLSLALTELVGSVPWRHSGEKPLSASQGQTPGRERERGGNMPGSAQPAASPGQQTAYTGVMLRVRIFILSPFQKKKKKKKV